MPRIETETLAQHRDWRRNQLIEAAASIALESGGAAVTVAAVAQRAGLSRTSVYEYFGSSADLIADLVLEELNNFAGYLRNAVAETQEPIESISATSKAGAALTFASVDSNCALKGTEITPLKGAGQCAISVTSAGNATASGMTAILPIQLTLGVQTIPAIAAKRSVKLASTTNFGQKITYTAVGKCAVKKNVLTATKGKCTINAYAEGLDGLFEMLQKKVVLNIK